MSQSHYVSYQSSQSISSSFTYHKQKKFKDYLGFNPNETVDGDVLDCFSFLAVDFVKRVCERGEEVREEFSERKKRLRGENESKEDGKEEQDGEKGTTPKTTVNDDIKSTKRQKTSTIDSNCPRQLTIPTSLFSASEQILPPSNQPSPGPTTTIQEAAETNDTTTEGKKYIPLTVAQVSEAVTRIQNEQIRSKDFGLNRHKSKALSRR